LEPFLLFVLFVIVIIALAIFAAIQAAKRRKELEAWARSKGLSFSADSDYSMDQRFGHFSALQTGSNRYAYNVSEGPWNELAVCAFDYHYETYSRDSKGRSQTHHHHFSCLVVDTNLPLKPLFIRTEHFFDKVGEFFGLDDIDFESAEFSREFCVKSPDKKWAYDVLHQETMEFLLNAPRFTLDFQGPCILATRDSTFAVADFEAAFGVVEGIVKRLPRSLLQELEGVP
jgi:hypothetical protein